MNFAAQLPGIHDAEALRWSPFRGALFENETNSEKMRFHQETTGGLFFRQDYKGLEIEVLVDSRSHLPLICGGNEVQNRSDGTTMLLGFNLSQFADA